jgi:hypothetical protein
MIVDGIEFSIRNGRYYGKNNLALHRYVWEKINGDIPKGYCIHHADFNPLNNDISNLVLLTNGEHTALHNSTTKKDRSGYVISDESRIKISLVWKNKKRSDENKEKIRQHILLMPNVKCPYCGKEGKYRARFKHLHFENCKEKNK